MKLSADGKDYIVHLEYPPIVHHEGVRHGERSDTMVKATVHEGACERPEEKAKCVKLSAIGVAFGHPKDQFVRATGRKIALGRALQILGLDKRERTLLWADYRTKAS